MLLLRSLVLALSFLAIAAAQQIPRPAGALTIETLAGESIEVASSSENAVAVVVFTPGGCAVCEEALTTLAAIAGEVPGFAAVGVAVDTTQDPAAFAADVQDFTAALNLPYPVGVASGDAVSAFLGEEDAFGGRISKTPPVFVLLDGRGIIWAEEDNARSRGGGSTFWLNAAMNMRTAIEERLAAPVGPVLYSGGVVNAASFTPAGELGHQPAFGSIVSIFGHSFTDSFAQAETSPLPTELNGVSVLVNGEPLPLFFVSPGQINAQLPFSAGGGRRDDAGPRATVVTTPGGDSNTYEFTAVSAAPATFTFDNSGKGQGIVVFAGTATLAAPAGLTHDSRPAVAGDVLTIFANGLGPVTPEIEAGRNSCDPDGECAADFSNLTLRHLSTPETLYIGGERVPAENVVFQGLAPEFVGLYQVNFVLPEGMPAGEEVELVFGGNRGALRVGSGLTIAVGTGE